MTNQSLVSVIETLHLLISIELSQTSVDIGVKFRLIRGNLDQLFARQDTSLVIAAITGQKVIIEVGINRCHV